MTMLRYISPSVRKEDFKNKKKEDFVQINDKAFNF